MGGLGALVLALRNPDEYVSVSAFSPIVSPSQVPWGQQAFAAYLGENKDAWLDYDPVSLISQGQRVADIVIHFVMFIPRRLRRVQVKPGTLPEIVTVSICDMTASRTGVRRNNNNVVLSRVTLHPRFSNEILLVAGQA